MSILKTADSTVRQELGSFVREFNRRERMVRIEKSCTFEGYYRDGHYSHRDEWGTGWVVEGRAVPYFHPNRSFHDEVIWLNNNLFYRKDVTFEDKLVNAAIVKFYGPSNTLKIATTGTPWQYVNFTAYREDRSYALRVLNNIEEASRKKMQLWGTTELRTSLQTASRDYSRKNPSLIDIELRSNEVEVRKMRPSDMVHWISSLAEQWSNFYMTKPTMSESFNMLTQHRGIGNYYGYHFSSNLARMPGIGAAALIEAEHLEEFKSLGVQHGRLDENDDYVVAGPGAMATLQRLFPKISISTKTAMSLLVEIRDRQEQFFNIAGDISAERDLKESTELGRYTTFGCEIACCQFNVFERAAREKRVALQRSNAPISTEVGQEEAHDIFG